MNNIVFGTQTYKIGRKEKKEIKVILKFFNQLHCEKCFHEGMKVIYELSKSWVKCPIWIQCPECKHEKIIGYFKGELK